MIDTAVGRERLLVFNIGGNKYRLIARVKYEWGLLNVRAVLTHDQYNKGTWKCNPPSPNPTPDQAVRCPGPWPGCSNATPPSRIHGLSPRNR